MVNSWAGRTICTPFGNGPVTGPAAPGEESPAGGHPLPPCLHTGKADAYPLWGPEHCADGFPHIRKPHYMFGWDWGPCLPDMGIWKPVELIAVDGGLFRELSVRQIHENGRVRLLIKTDLDGGADGELTQFLRLIGPGRFPAGNGDGGGDGADGGAPPALVAKRIRGAAAVYLGGGAAPGGRRCWTPCANASACAP